MPSILISYLYARMCEADTPPRHNVCAYAQWFSVLDSDLREESSDCDALECKLSAEMQL